MHKKFLTLVYAVGLLVCGGPTAQSQQNTTPSTVQVHMVITEAALREDAELPSLSRKQDVKVKQEKNFLQVTQLIQRDKKDGLIRLRKLGKC